MDSLYIQLLEGTVALSTTVAQWSLSRGARRRSATSTTSRSSTRAFIDFVVGLNVRVRIVLDSHHLVGQLIRGLG